LSVDLSISILTMQSRRRTGQMAKVGLADRPGQNCSFGRTAGVVGFPTLKTVWSALASLWAEPAVKSPPRRGRRDWALFAILMTAVALEAIFRGDLVWRPVSIVFGFALGAAVLVRRTHPLETVAFAFGTFAVLDVATFIADTDPVVLYTGAVVLLFAYSLFRWGSGRQAAIGLGFMAMAFIASVATDFTGVTDALGGAVVLLLSAALGASIRYRHAARDQLIERAKLQERELLARELHDTVAHHVSAIAIQAQAGLFLARSSSLRGAVEALEIIEHEASQTLAEMRTMVGALRDREAQPDVAPQRGIAEIAQLASNGTDPIRIDVELGGELTHIAPAVEAALYRVAQESVTNARRHAHQATRVDVKVIGSLDDVRLTVSDNGARTSATTKASGYGLVGMTERVTLLGGTFTAGPNPDRGWAVEAVLPRHGDTT
jgi:signal transduction histidine kinase